MSERVARIFKLKIEPTKNDTKSQLFSATGTKIVIVGNADVNMYITMFTCHTECHDSKRVTATVPIRNGLSFG